MIAARVAPAPPATMADQMWPMVAFSLALCVLAVAGMAVDVRTLGEANVWVKPLKFASSFVIYFATLALVVDRMGAAARRGRVLRDRAGRGRGRDDRRDGISLPARPGRAWRRISISRMRIREPHVQR